MGRAMPRLRQCTASGYGQDVAARKNPTPTPQHTVQIDDELWDAAQRIAAKRRETVSDIVRHALVEYVDKHHRAASED
jgi:Tfp pilus assembly protein FimV